MSVGSYLMLVGIGALPSLIWLTYWLRKDSHPEPKAMITKVLLLGIIFSPLAIAFQLLFVQFVSQWLNIDPGWLSNSPWFYFWAALVEEFVKYLAVFAIVFRSPAFDEPVDAMIYMLTAALGFAAMENILVINRVIGDGIGATIGIFSLRFAGATLLHALSSALLGYFIALSWFALAHRRTMFFIGLFLATFFHWAFNMFISQAHQVANLLLTTALLMVMAFLVSVLFDKIQQRDTRARPTTV